MDELTKAFKDQKAEYERSWSGCNRHPESESEEEKPEEEWSLKIIRVANGYILRCIDGISVIEDDEQDDLKAHVELLYCVMDHFNFQGSKHDKERIKVIREEQQ